MPDLGIIDLTKEFPLTKEKKKKSKMPVVGVDIRVESPQKCSSTGKKLYTITKRIEVDERLLTWGLQKFRLKKHDVFLLLANPYTAFIIKTLLTTKFVNLRDCYFEGIPLFYYFLTQIGNENAKEIVKSYLTVAVDAENAQNVYKSLVCCGYNELARASCKTLIQMIFEGIYDIPLWLPDPMLLELFNIGIERLIWLKAVENVKRSIPMCDLTAQNLVFTMGLVVDLHKGKPYPDTDELRDLKAHRMKESSWTNVIADLYNDSEDKFWDRENKDVVVEYRETYSVNYMTFNIQGPEILEYVVQFSLTRNEGVHTTTMRVRGYFTRRQHLYFTETAFKFIRITGNFTGINGLKYYYNPSPPRYFRGIPFPETNVATPTTARAIPKDYNTSNNEIMLLHGSKRDFTMIPITRTLTVVLNQPYFLDSCQLMLCDTNDREYSYTVEIEVAPGTLIMISNKTHEKVRGLQTIKFSPRLVLAFHIKAISATKDKCVRVLTFEAPATFVKAAPMIPRLPINKLRM